jgi:hypothetical protein
MSTLRVNKISNLNDNGPIELSKGLNVPSGHNISGEVVISTTGIATITSLVSQNINISGILTSSLLYGNASNMSNVPGVSNSKAIAFNLIA